MAEIASITGSTLYDLVTCEMRVAHDLGSDPERRDPANQFVQLLWSGGAAHETEMLAGLPGDIVDLRDVPFHDRAAATLAALASDADCILGGRLEVDDMVGMPDVIRRVDGTWRAGDVKSGGAFEADGRRPRLAYAVQVGLYGSLLGQLGAGDPDTAFVIGRDGREVEYDLTAPWSRDGSSVAGIVVGLVDRARSIRDGAADVRGALSATCKLCCWHTLCAGELRASDDLTLIAGLGRAMRDAMAATVPTVRALADVDLASVTAARGRTTIPGLGIERFVRFRDRARLLSTPGSEPYARRPLGLRRVARELHFDIESDPSRDGLVYLHGVVERVAEPGGDVEKFVPFLADGPAGERDAFASAYAYLAADPAAMIYYYSKFERTAYRDLQRRYHDVCSEADIERLFDPARAIDLLFDVVMPYTEWPTHDVSIKTLARRLGFAWRDTQASGANS